ncbi:probable oxidoreductase (aldo-keto reductase family protein) [Natronomonas moolapensis 8.8.11]|uniref:Probable oxidoreductase (Aldo-keto reductase family protein) n=1 Tax=Natronomonas moolapensis (strain DSM 18674 / CECT 7526 / JCM 14361 / 8.8.11) TaxID=268739 RepID=M1XL70_NATM8|nr:aldo/keto reductase [Natronomonas moolapensis]CCQ37189.1 probable oxidoreductase (aldo-keto reductase family protein) [Natronomonas moolapensis 8.8.11]
MDTTTAGGVDVPSVGLGTWRLTGDRCREAARTALELGYRHLDTAQEYDNERQVGAALRDSDVDREDVFVTTKLGRGNRDYDGVRRSTEESLAKLGTSYVDLLLIHWPNVTTPLRETLAAMNELVEEGTVKHVGVSNFDIDRLDRARELSEHGILTDQVQYNPYWSQTELLDYCRIHDVLVTAYSPLAHGGVVDDPVLEAIGEGYEKSPAQVAIRWLVQQPNVITVPKATSRAHIAANCDVFDFVLDDDEMERIRQPSRARAAAGFLRSRFRELGCS